MSEEKKGFNPVRTNVASGVIIEKDGKYLLVQEKQKHVYGLWNFPAGFVEKGLTLEENAVKEAKEETGYDVRIISKVGVFQENAESVAKSAFEAEIVGGELKIQEDEILDAKWFTYDEILKMKDKLRDKWVLDAINLLSIKRQADNYLDNWRRCQADFENYKKDQAKIMTELRKFVSADVIFQILPVLDNFNASLEHVPENEKNNAWVTGIIHIKRQLEEVLKNNDVSEIEVKEGDTLDPLIHEAIISDQETKTKEKKNIIKKIVQKGYKINNRVIRAAKVITD